MAVELETGSGTTLSYSRWVWRPIWDYVRNQYPQYGDHIHTRVPDGDALTADDARALAELLRADCVSGEVASYYQSKFDRFFCRKQ